MAAAFSEGPVDGAVWAPRLHLRDWRCERALLSEFIDRGRSRDDEGSSAMRRRKRAR